MSEDSNHTEIEATFAESADADAAVASLIGAGISPSSIDLQHRVLPEARAAEGRFVWRVLLIIVFWSIAGALPGAAFGFLLAKTIGPEGSAGLIVQLACWIIVGHLMGGMLAGYFVLADRTHREMPPDRPLTLLTVGDVAERDAKNVQRLLQSHHALTVTAGRSDGPVHRP